MTRRAAYVAESEPTPGSPRAAEGEAEGSTECDRSTGLPSRYIDAETEVLGNLAAMWMDFQQMRKAAAQRDLTEADVATLLHAEEYFAKALTKALAHHPVYPHLPSGLRGVHVARLIARIGDPRRFPGQQCSLGHTFPPKDDLSSATSVAGCPFVNRTTGERCPGDLLPPRTTSGTRALYCYFGLDGPRKDAKSGHRYDRLGKTALLQPGGIAEQIVRQRVQPYRDIYDAFKAKRSGADIRSESDNGDGFAGLEEAGAGGRLDSDVGVGPRPFQLDRIARKVAAKAFLADLLAEWKRIVAAEGSAGSEEWNGHHDAMGGPAGYANESDRLLGRAAA